MGLCASEIHRHLIFQQSEGDPFSPGRRHVLSQKSVIIFFFKFEAHSFLLNLTNSGKQVAISIAQLQKLSLESKECKN